MIEILDQWLANARMVRFDVKHDFFSRCYGSSDQLFILAEFINQADLETRWEVVARAVATEIQAKMDASLDDMRWDTYLLCCVADAVDEHTRTEVETDRRFFRKLVLDGDLDKAREKIPIRYDADQVAQAIANPLNDETFFEELLQQLDETNQSMVMSLIRASTLPDDLRNQSVSRLIDEGDDK